MTVPDWFRRQLEAESDGRLRIRWSHQAHRFLIEARTARPQPLHARVESWDDQAIRARDGYELVMDVAPGDRSRCPQCQRWTHLPIRRVAEAKCEHCGHTFRAFFWPLDEALLQHLRYIDPDRGGLERVFREADAGEDLRDARLRRHRRNQTEAIWKEDYARVAGIPSVGYTGREQYWPVGR